MRFSKRNSVALSPLAVFLLFSRPVASIPQIITSASELYSTDVNGNTVAGWPISASVVTDVNGDVLSTAAVTGSEIDGGFGVGATASTAASSAAATVTPAPVTVTNPLGPAPPTTFVYTTVDGDGNTDVITDTFTPTYQASSYSPSYISATVLAYTDFTSIYQLPTAEAGSGSRPRAAFEGSSGLLWSGAATVAAILAGARMVAML